LPSGFYCWLKGFAAVERQLNPSEPMALRLRRILRQQAQRDAGYKLGADRGEALSSKLGQIFAGALVVLAFNRAVSGVEPLVSRLTTKGHQALVEEISNELLDLLRGPPSVRIARAASFDHVKIGATGCSKSLDQHLSNVSHVSRGAA
jgi:hypothetical protein